MVKSKLLLCAVLLCLVLVGCSTGTNIPSPSSSPASSNNLGSGATGGVHLFVEPDAGEGAILDALHGAKKSVWLEMYLLTDRKIINALEEDARQGLDVRVMLEVHPYGSGPISPRETLDKLKAAGVKAQATNSTFQLTHEKGMIIDGQSAYTMTCNFTLSALGASNNQQNREYGIIDTNQQDVQAVSAIFTADWDRTTPQYNAPNLVVSPDNSQTDLLALIRNAHKTLLIEAEEMQDQAVEQALTDAVERGVQVQVILPMPQNGGNDSNSEGITTIKQGNVQVKEDPRLYMHAKMMVIDGQQAFVGSENFSDASLNGNRELGIILADQTVISTLQQTFQTDWRDSQNV